MGGSDHNTGTAEICTGDLVNDLCSFAASVDIQGDVFGTWGNFDAVVIGLPRPVIECLIALPFLLLEPLANFVLANSQWVSFGESGMFPFGTCTFEWVIHVVLIL